jgi:hypothetical protein
VTGSLADTLLAKVGKLERLSIHEVSAVDDPANEVPGWMIAKAAGGDAPAGVTVVPLGGKSFIAIADESNFYKTLRASGDEALVEHLQEIIDALAPGSKAKTASRAAPSDALARTAERWAREVAKGNEALSAPLQELVGEERAVALVSKAMKAERPTTVGILRARGRSYARIFG